MKRFDVCRTGGNGLAGRGRLAVILQHEHLSDLATVVVAPLFPEGDLPVASRVRVLVDVQRKRYVAAVDRLAAMPKAQLRSPIANLGGQDHEFIRAIDLLFSGF